MSKKKISGVSILRPFMVCHGDLAYAMVENEHSFEEMADFCADLIEMLITYDDEGDFRKSLISRLKKTLLKRN
jgi:hypothetical protein